MLEYRDTEQDEAPRHRGKFVRPLRTLWLALPWLLVGLLALQLYPSRTSNTELSGAVSRLAAQISDLEKQQEMPAIVLKRHRNAICYIYAVYTFEWPSTSVVRRLERHTRVSGTGFLVSDDLIATNRHVVEPWFEDSDDEEQIRLGAKPKIEKLVAFFPGMMDPLKLNNVHVSPEEDLAVAKLADGPLPDTIRPLPLAAEDPEVGDAVTVVGYPLGVSTMLAKSPSNLYKRLASTKDTIQVANELAANAMIRPSATCGHLSDVVNEKMIYDAPTAQGGSGGPVFNSKGEVIAINSAYIEGFNGGTIGVSTQGLKPLISQAERRRR